MRLRIATQNVHGFAGTGTHSGLRFYLKSCFGWGCRGLNQSLAASKLAEHWVPVAPDLLVLQEFQFQPDLVDEETGCQFEARTGLCLAEVIQLYRRLPGEMFRGFAVLARKTVSTRVEKVVRLPGYPIPRVAAILRVTRGEETVHAVITHLGVSRIARMTQWPTLRKIVESYSADVIVGDLNARGREVSRSMGEGWSMATRGIRTFPAWSPKRDIDHVLIRDSRMRRKGVGVVRLRCSDHLGVWADVETRKKEAA